MSYSVSDAFYSLQEEIGLWADKTFPNSKPMAALKHLEREIKELIEAEERGEPVGEEAADCVLILLHYAFQKKIHLYHEILAKHRINKGRTWGKPDAEGVVEHVRESSEKDRTV